MKVKKEEEGGKERGKEGKKGQNTENFKNLLKYLQCPRVAAEPSPTPTTEPPSARNPLENSQKTRKET